MAVTYPVAVDAPRKSIFSLFKPVEDEGKRRVEEDQDRYRPERPVCEWWKADETGKVEQAEVKAQPRILNQNDE